MSEKLVYYKSDKGIYVANKDNTGYYGRKELPVNEILINDKVPKETFHKSWLFVEGEKEILSFKKRVSGKRVNFRWELIDENNLSLSLPKVISQEDSFEKYNDDDWGWYEIGKESKYYSVRNLYKRENDVLEDYYEEVDLESFFWGEIKSEWAENLVNAVYKVYKCSYKSEGLLELDLSNIARYSELEKILTSDLLIHNRPCSITSKQTYDIVRYWVLDHIDPIWACVTSDYDFCFTVKKKIAIKPYINKQEVVKGNGRSYAKPRFKSWEVNHIQKEIFEMTNDEKNYRGYTVIKGFKGDSLEDLCNNVKSYLDELMEYINAPLSQCEHCNGTGHIFGEIYDMNKR